MSPSKDAPRPHVPANPCKGGRANWKICKKTRKTTNSAENNRGEQRKNREIRGSRTSRSPRPLSSSPAWTHTWTIARPAPPLAALILLKLHAFSLLPTTARSSQQKTRRGHPPGPSHNSDSYLFILEFSYVCKEGCWSGCEVPAGGRGNCRGYSLRAACQPTTASATASVEAK